MTTLDFNDREHQFRRKGRIFALYPAQAFQSVRYPILPRVERVPAHQRVESRFVREEILHIRHHSLFVPRDFDLSPYFQVVKPTIEHGFDHHKLGWGDMVGKPAAASRERDFPAYHED